MAGLGSLVTKNVKTLINSVGIDLVEVNKEVVYSGNFICMFLWLEVAIAKQKVMV